MKFYRQITDCCLLKKILIGAVLLVSTNAFCATLWQERNIYSAAESLREGDTITVEVNDLSRLRYDLSVDNKNTNAVNSDPDQTITGFLPSVAASKNVSNSDNVEMSSRTTMTMRIAVSVTGRAANGNYTVQGSRQYVVNGVASGLAISGEINPRSISGSTIRSESIVNFRMVITTTRQGLGLNLDRQLAQDAAASTELTEQEKQQIITDYLQKMLGELTR